MRSWEEEKKRFRETNFIKDDILLLNVGGFKGISVSKSLLVSNQGTALEAMFSGRHELKKLDGKIFVDRDPIVFK